MTALPWQVHWLLFRHNPLLTLGMWLHGLRVEIHSTLAPQHYQRWLVRKLETDPAMRLRLQMFVQIEAERRAHDSTGEHK